jgi:hypothetical protein
MVEVTVAHKNLTVAETVTLRIKHNLYVSIFDLNAAFPLNSQNLTANQKFSAL